MAQSDTTFYPQLSYTEPHSSLMALVNFTGTLPPSTCTGSVSYSASMISKAYNHTWIIEFGATDHMTSNKDLLFNIKPCTIPFLFTHPNGYKVKVTCTGSFYFLSFILHHVLYISNIVSSLSLNSSPNWIALLSLLKFHIFCSIL